jgi:hypothetical protein
MDRRYQSNRQREYEEIVDIPADYNIGSLIGTRGANILAMKERTNCHFIKILAETRKVNMSPMNV